MRVLESKISFRTGTLLLLCANALPVAGLVLFGWQPVQALFVSWVEIGVVLLGYLVVVLFGQRDSHPERKTGGSYPGPVRFPVPDGSLGLPGSLPPLRYRNAQYVPAAVPFVAIVWVLLSRAFLDFPNPGVVIDGRAEVALVVGYIVRSSTPEGLAIAAAIQLISIWRDFLARRLVDHYSAAMLVELPLRVAGIWFAVVLLLAPAYIATVVLDPDPTVVGWGFFTLLLGTKLAVDRALLRLRYEPEVGWFTRLFVPNERETEADDTGTVDTVTN